MQSTVQLGTSDIDLSQQKGALYRFPLTVESSKGARKDYLISCLTLVHELKFQIGHEYDNLSPTSIKLFYCKKELLNDDCLVEKGVKLGSLVQMKKMDEELDESKVELKIPDESDNKRIIIPKTTKAEGILKYLIKHTGFEDQDPVLLAEGRQVDNSEEISNVVCKVGDMVDIVSKNFTIGIKYSIGSEDKQAEIKYCAFLTVTEIVRDIERSEGLNLENYALLINNKKVLDQNQKLSKLGKINLPNSLLFMQSFKDIKVSLDSDIYYLNLQIPNNYLVMDLQLLLGRITGYNDITLHSIDGTYLTQDAKLEDMNEQICQNLKMKCSKMKVVSNNKDIYVNFFPEWHASELKEDISMQIGLSIYEFELFLPNSQTLNGEKKLFEYEIDQNTTTYIMPRLKGGCKIKVVVDNQKEELIDINLDGKISDLKEEIAKKLQVSPCYLKIFKGEQELNDINVWVDYNVKPDDKLKLKNYKGRKVVKITFKQNNYSYHDVIDMNILVQFLKHQISFKINMYKDNFYLQYNGKTMENNQRVCQCVQQMDQDPIEIQVCMVKHSSVRIKTSTKKILTFDKIFNYTRDELIDHISIQAQIPRERLYVTIKNGKLIVDQLIELVVFVQNYHTYKLYFQQDQLKLSNIMSYFSSLKLPSNFYLFKDGIKIQNENQLLAHLKNNIIMLHLDYELEESKANPTQIQYLNDDKVGLIKQNLAVREAEDCKITDDMVKEELQKAKINVQKQPLPNTIGVDLTLKHATYFLELYTDIGSSETNQMLAKLGYPNLKYSLCQLYRAMVEQPANSKLFYQRNDLLYRGAKYVDAEAYKVGNKYFWSAFSSTSMDKETAEGFMLGCSGVIFVIEPSPNYPATKINVQGFSKFPQEEEILLLPNFYFTVTKKEKLSGVDHIYVKEVPYQNLLDLRKNHLKKLIWFDMQIFNEENLGYQRELIKQFPNLQAIDDQELFFKVARYHLPEFTLIISGSAGQQIIPQIHNWPSLNKVIVFTANEAKYRHLAEQYPKVDSICVEFNQIKNVLSTINFSTGIRKQYFGNTNQLSNWVFNQIRNYAKRQK